MWPILQIRDATMIPFEHHQEREPSYEEDHSVVNPNF